MTGRRFGGYARWGALAVAGALVFSSSCATVPLADSQQDVKEKELHAPRGSSVIYLYRNETWGGLTRMTVLMDGAYAGETASKTYMVWILRPGRHVIVSKGENDSRLELVTEPGKKYYVWQEAKIGLTAARSSLSLVPEAQGESEILNCKLVQPVGDSVH